MENLEKRKQQALIRSIILNVLGLTILGAIGFMYILPTYTVLSGKITEINALQADLQNKLDN